MVFAILKLAAVKTRRAADMIDDISNDIPSFKDFRNVIQVRYRFVITRNLTVQPGLLQERRNRRDLEPTRKLTITER